VTDRAFSDGDLPLDDADLERLRFQARREMRASGLGAVRRRRIGQSLEYRDHRGYVPGDDVRLIDWRTSERFRAQGRDQEGDLLVRTFEAEERFTIVTAVDNRPDMMLPDAAPAGMVAGWIVEGVGAIAAREKLAMRFLPLFDGGPAASRLAVHKAVLPAARAFRAGLTKGPLRAAAADQPALRTEAIARVLPPACAVIIITTATFDDPDGRFAALMARAQAGYRHVILALLDPWPHERALLAQGSVRLDAVPGRAARDGVYDPAAEELDASERALAQHRAALTGPGRRMMQFRFGWPAVTAGLNDSVRAAFRPWFMQFVIETQLFARDHR
jgi:uncharacterized protein (DUF58 family)